MIVNNNITECGMAYVIRNDLIKGIDLGNIVIQVIDMVKF